MNSYLLVVSKNLLFIFFVLTIDIVIELPKERVKRIYNILEACPPPFPNLVCSQISQIQQKEREKSPQILC